MITVHHLENSRSQRVLWLLEELGLRYQVRRYARDPATKLAPPELRAVHPLGKSPVITDDGITVAESGAIIEYLLDAHDRDGRLRPAAGTEALRRFRYWLHFAEGSAMPFLLMQLVFDRVRSAPMPFFARPIARGIADKVVGGFVAPNLQRQADFIESGIAERGPWFTGADFSAADVQMSYPVEAMESAGLLRQRPALAAWLQRIHARPAYQRALATGGPYRVRP